MKRSLKEILARIVILFIGLTIAHFGVTLFLLSDLGADPFNVLIQGLFHTAQGALNWSFLTHGGVHRIICFLIILVLLVVDRSYVKIGTVICMFCGGPIIDVFSAMLSGVFAAMPYLWFKLLMLAAGCVILAFGMTIVIKSDAGTGPNDLVALVISEKSGKPFSILRVVTDVCFVAAGFLMGGIFGIGTIICACLVGPVAGFLMPGSAAIVRFLLGVVGVETAKA